MKGLLLKFPQAHHDQWFRTCSVHCFRRQKGDLEQCELTETEVDGADGAVLCQDDFVVTGPSSG